MLIRDVVAALVAVLLIVVALGLATSLTRDRRQRRRERIDLGRAGQTILAEIPTEAGLVFFTEDATTFRFGSRVIDKTAIASVRVLINGAPIAAASRPEAAATNAVPPTIVAPDPDGIARDRWDVVIESGADTVVIPCGAIRERISQELARNIFGALKRVVTVDGG